MIKTPNRLFTEILNSDFSIIKVNKKTSFQNKSQYGSYFNALNLLIVQQKLKKFVKSLRFISKKSLFSLLIFCKIFIFEKTNLLKIKILYYFICVFLLLVKKSNLTEINSFTRFQSSFNLKTESIC